MIKSAASSLAWLSCLSLASAATVYTGDQWQGFPIISNLDITNVPSNAVSRFWLSPAAGQGGLPYFVPIFVARGNKESLENGRKLSLSAGIHGDELNSVAIIQDVFKQLNETVAAGDFNGTVIGLPTVNPQGYFLNQRNFFSSTWNGFYHELNALFPGTSVEDGGTIEQSYIASIWNNILGNTSNVDIAVDLQTLATGSKGPLWVYADYSFPYVQRVAELLNPDIIKIDPGAGGTIETTLIGRGVPAVTVETGSPKSWDRALIKRTVDFVFRLLDDLKVTQGEVAEPDLSQTYIAQNFSFTKTKFSGFFELDVDVLDDVEEGQVIGKVYNAWGDELQDLTASVSGRVLIKLVDPVVEAGVAVATIAYNATDA